MQHDRREHPRVEVTAPVLAGRVGHDVAARGVTAPPVAGALLNVSLYGMAFSAGETLSAGSLVELVVRCADGSTCLQKHARVVGCVEDALHRRVVRCAFMEPLRDLDWVPRLTGAAEISGPG